MAQWRNGSASDSRSEGWEFESLLGQVCDGGVWSATAACRWQSVGGSRSGGRSVCGGRSVVVGPLPPPSSVSNQAADHPTKQASKHQSFVIPHQEQARPHAHAHRLFSQVEWVPICSTTSQITLFCDLHTRDGTRTHNLLLRREAPYPLGHTSVGTGKVDLLHFELLGSCGV